MHGYGGMVRPEVWIALLCAGLAACAEPKCGGSDLKYYDQAIAYQLGKHGVRADVRNDGMVCVAGRHAAEFDTAVREADKYFHEIADLLKDECEERAFVQWATREKLRFDVRSTLSADGSPGKRMFLLRSFNAEEVSSNRQRLTRDAPKDVACPAKS
jgi:hypothetical protein